LIQLLFPPLQRSLVLLLKPLSCVFWSLLSELSAAPVTAAAANFCAGH